MTDTDRDAWFDTHTWQYPGRGVAELRALKKGRRVSVVLPALDEQATVGALVTGLVPLTRGDAPLVDELVVMDSGSTDRTRAVAAEAGARVVAREDVLPGLDVRPGKGEVLWRSLAATTGDLIVFLDSDLVEIDPEFLVPALLEPLLARPDVRLVKGFYRRPLRLGATEADTGGGRVTELLVRPLLAALHPGLTGVVQPLGGEYAATRALLESLPFAPGYGVEIGLLLDTHTRHGLHAVAQANLGVRKHRNRSLLELGVMSRQILATVLRRGPDVDGGDPLVQFRQQQGAWTPVEHTVEERERPPMREVRVRSV
ncbi:glucosyl-3-phosphoglycerate synthase [Pseudonocardia endophytica]|uniref:Glucosyl-3-phosphoglycerate synthase n=1 Tax=Pseudonocardia endophytica TaxID=401976 RepID=A0A4V2PHR3_PSEEN|nr:glucosyl-3-phosphoglycerate synthase [Pseudonocardia endophytica]TCK21726.1 glucosyl-3-phosphoglycerate synthase [Pseudonocardia endophytica]